VLLRLAPDHVLKLFLPLCGVYDVENIMGKVVKKSLPI
jgi:hypothetical protein